MAPDAVRALGDVRGRDYDQLLGLPGQPVAGARNRQKSAADNRVPGKALNLARVLKEDGPNRRHSRPRLSPTQPSAFTVSEGTPPTSSPRQASMPPPPGTRSPARTGGRSPRALSPTGTARRASGKTRSPESTGSTRASTSTWPPSRNAATPASSRSPSPTSRPPCKLPAGSGPIGIGSPRRGPYDAAPLLIDAHQESGRRVSAVDAGLAP